MIRTTPSRRRARRGPGRARRHLDVRADRPAAGAQARRSGLSRRRGDGVAQRHRAGSAEPLSDRPRLEGLLHLRGRREAGDQLLQPHHATHRAVAAARHERQHGQRLATAQEAAVGFARKLRPQDLAQVVDFDTRVEILQDFTSDAAALEKAIRSAEAGGSTSMYNALYISLKELAKIKAKSDDDVRRRAVVLLSDGEDTSSLVSFEEVLDLAKRSATTVYSIGLQSKDTGFSKGFREAEFVLRQLAQETGGRAFFPQRVEDLAGIYGVIADELASQYTLGYASTNAKRDGGWRRLTVQTNRQGTTARTKRGYFAPAS